MNIAICDDEPIFVDDLKSCIEEFFETTHLSMPNIFTFTKGIDIIECHEKIDFLFLDMEMPEMNGISVAKEIKKKNRNILIFVVSAYDMYLDSAMDVKVFRYLSKPIDKNRLFTNLSRALEVYTTDTIKIPLETEGVTYTIFLSDIIMVKSERKKLFSTP